MTLATLPNPPTDNIYKFCALAGTVILILSFYFPLESYYNACEKFDTVESKQEVIIIELDYLKKKVDSTKKIIDNSIAEQNEVRIVDKNKLTIRYSESEIKQMISEQQESARNISIKNAELKSLIKEANRLASISGTMKFLSLLTIVLGSTLAVYGYLSWYYKIQKYEDIRIKNSVTKQEET
jgi:hypothetical protein